MQIHLKRLGKKKIKIIEVTLENQPETLEQLIQECVLAGDATLSDQAKLNFVNARFDHQIQGSKDTLVSLSDNANWALPSSTIIGNLSLNNSQITLNPDFATQTNNQTFNQLTVLGDLSGNGTFNYRTYLQENKGDHVMYSGVLMHIRRRS